MNNFSRTQKMKKNIIILGAITTVLIIGLLAGAMYLIMPTLSLGYYSNNMLVGFIALFLIGTIASAGASFSYENKVSKIWLLALLPILFIGYNVYVSSVMLNTEEYVNLIGDVQTYDYKEEQPNITTIPVVDEELANKLGDKTLGADINISSKYTTGEYFLVEYQDDLAWVAPLEPTTFFKWNKDKSSPGYVYVSATDTNDVKLVTDKEVNYSNGAYFSNYLGRHIYQSGYRTVKWTKPAFEIDEDGNPYWIVSTYKSSIGTSGYITDKVLVIDATTGDIEEFEPGKEPKWVDRVYDRSLIYNQIDYNGTYRNGYFNFSGEGQLSVSGGDSTSYILVDGEPYMYTGLTSQQSDESTIGFLLVSLKNKDVKYYKLTGATEVAAAYSAQGELQQYGYLASYPMLTNVNEQATYFMTMKDGQGLIKQYAYVSVEDYSIVGTGTTQQAALDTYSARIGGVNNSSSGKDSINKETPIIEDSVSVEEDVVTNVQMNNGQISLTFEDGTEATYKMV